MEKLTVLLPRWRRAAIAASLLTAFAIALSILALAPLAGELLGQPLQVVNRWTLYLAILATVHFVRERVLGYESSDELEVASDKARDGEAERTLARVDARLVEVASVLDLKANRFRVSLSRFLPKSLGTEHAQIRPKLFGRTPIEVNSMVARRLSDAQLRADLGHELGHAEAPFVLVRTLYLVLLSIWAASACHLVREYDWLAPGAIGKMLLFDLCAIALSIGCCVVHQWASRWQERYCDLVGAKASSLAEAGTSLLVSQKLFERAARLLKRRRRWLPSAPWWLASHPPTAERVAYLARLAQ